MTSGREFWPGHPAAIEVEAVTTKAYAEREGLAVGSLYAWRRRLKGEQQSPRRPPRSGGFVPVLVRPTSEPAGCTLMIGAGTRLELLQLPSPEWLAALSAALVGRGR